MNQFRYKTNESICISCKNYSITKSGYHQCSKRGQHSSNDGYGSFDVGAKCIFDVMMLSNMYEPVDMLSDKMIEIQKNNDKLFSENYKLKQDIKTLSEALEIKTAGNKSNLNL